MPRFSKRSGREVLDGHPRLPEWIVREKVNLSELHAMKAGMRESALHTVCEEARCPNRNHCFTHGTATFLLMGDTCTRACGFCSIRSGRPLPLNPLEPEETALRVAALGLKFAVLTSVNRDDLPDGGAAQFAQTIRWIRTLLPACGVEVLVPDFRGNEGCLATVLEAGPNVLNHNVETVERLYRRVRPDADYAQSLRVLAGAAARRDASAPALRVKSGIMVGLGETPEEVLDLMGHWRDASVDIATLGQYLPPSPLHP